MTTITPDSRQVDTSKIPLLKQRFLKAVPMPVNDEGEDLYTFNEHLSRFMWDRVRLELKEGKRLLAMESGEDIIIE